MCFLVCSGMHHMRWFKQPVHILVIPNGTKTNRPHINPQLCAAATGHSGSLAGAPSAPLPLPRRLPAWRMPASMAASM